MLPPNLMTNRSTADALRARQAEAVPTKPKPNLDGYRSKLERQYADHLEWLRTTSEIRAWYYEPVKLRLARLTHYTPDFLVVLADGALELHEVKGFWRDDARLKIKVAADKYGGMFRFVAVERKHGAWMYERF